MYIRRKVFSVALDESGEERYFSTNEIMSEDAYLDELMFAEGAEAAAEKAPSWLAKKAGAVKKWYMKEGGKGWKGLNKTKAGLTAAGVLAVPGAIVGAKALKRRKARKAAEEAAAAELAEANYSYYENLYSDDDVQDVEGEEMVMVPKKALSKNAKLALGATGLTAAGAGIGALTGRLKKEGIRRGKYMKRGLIGGGAGLATAAAAYGGYRGIKALKARKAAKRAAAEAAMEEGAED